VLVSVPNLLAVDGNSLAHRAFHALRHDEPDGPFVTRGVVRMLASAWIEGPFDAVVVAFDSPDNRRKALYPEYKAHRPDKDPELYRQLDTLREHLAACGFAVVEEPGSEADDLLAAAADACASRGWRCAVLSSDRDLLALVSETTTLLRPRQSMSDLRRYDPREVEAEYGVRPDQYTDLAALRGDPSDGLKGAKGVGPKIAGRLLRDYGDVPGIYANLTNCPPRVEAALRASRPDVERNLLLMAPLPNLSVDVEAVTAAGVDTGRVDRVLVALGMGAEAGRFRYAVERPPLPPLPPPPDDGPDDVMQEPVPAGPAAPIRAAVAILEGTQASLF
jgi:5'-3' exonuclease